MHADPLPPLLEVAILTKKYLQFADTKDVLQKSYRVFEKFQKDA